MKNKDNYLFFCHGIYSQWYISSFFDLDGIKYNCAEQYMMAKKAILFDDMNSYKNIMISEIPAIQKKLGRYVKNFDVDIWNRQAIKIVTTGNYFKFTQNKDLYVELYKSLGKEIVEASPYDKIWGIGMSTEHPDILNKELWQGTNWLGISIMNVRKLLFRK